MPPISQIIDSLLNGVSQQPQERRLDSQGQEQINGRSHRAHGLIKRPGTRFLAKLTSVVTGLDSAFVHTINRDSAERYHIVIANADAKVYDATSGDEVPVTFLTDKTYLGSNHRATTIGDTTILVNTDRVVARGMEVAAAPVFEALVAIRLADYGTNYSVTLNGVGVVLNSTTGLAPVNRAEISTDVIVSRLKTLLETSGAADDFEITQYGSSLHFIRTDGGDFTISASDGLADTAILAVKGTVQRFEDLPARAPDGFVVEIVGDPGNKFDNYFVVYDDSENPDQAGVWRETVQPGSLVAFDASTMPHKLTRNGSLISDTSVSAGAPPAPVVVLGGANVLTEPWDTGTDSGSELPSYQTKFIDQENEFVSANIEDVSGEPLAEIFFDVNTTRLAANSQARLVFSVSTTTDGNAGQTTIEQRVYGPGLSLINQKLSGFPVVEDDYNLRVELHYVGGDPGAGHRGVFTFHAQDNTEYPSIQLTTYTGRDVVLEAERKYPVGCAVNVVVDGTPISYTVVGSDETGTQVATALVPLIDALSGITATSPEEGVVRVVKSSGLPVLTTSATFDETTTYHDPDLSLTEDALVGSTIENQDDGSSAIISANTETTITFAALSGGNDNRFESGDLAAVRGSGLYFTYSQCSWRRREVGDLTTNHFPSFVGKRIKEVFYDRGRLGFTAEENAIYSAAGDLFNFFRQTVTALLDEDLIDVQSADASVAFFHSAVHWNDALYLLSDQGLYQPTGEPILTPKSIKLTKVVGLESSPDVRPIVLGKRLYVARKKTRHPQVFAYTAADANSKPTPFDTTRDIPSYIDGSPLRIAGDAGQEVLALLTDAGTRNHLYTYSYGYEGDDLVMNSWSKWEFPAGCRIVAFEFLEGKLALVNKYSDGLYLETLDLTDGV